MLIVSQSFSLLKTIQAITARSHPKVPKCRHPTHMAPFIVNMRCRYIWGRRRLL